MGDEFATATLEPSTVDDVLAGLKTVEEMASEVALLEDPVSGIAPERWQRVAYLSPRSWGGSVTGLAAAEAVRFDKTGAISVNGAPGRMGVWATFTTPGPGAYTITAQLRRVYPTIIGSCRFDIDGLDLGSYPVRTDPTSYTVKVRVRTGGQHSFGIMGVLHTPFVFYQLTVMQIPVVAPA